MPCAKSQRPFRATKQKSPELLRGFSMIDLSILILLLQLLQ